MKRTIIVACVFCDGRGVIEVGREPEPELVATYNETILEECEWCDAHGALAFQGTKCLGPVDFSEYVAQELAAEELA